MPRRRGGKNRANDGASTSEPTPEIPQAASNMKFDMEPLSAPYEAGYNAGNQAPSGADNAPRSALQVPAKRDRSQDDDAASGGEDEVMEDISRDGSFQNASRAASTRRKKARRVGAAEAEGPLGLEEEMRLGRAVDGATWISHIARDRGSSVCAAAQLSQLTSPRMVGDEQECKLTFRACDERGTPEEETILVTFRGALAEQAHMFLGQMLQRQAIAFISGMGAHLVKAQAQPHRVEVVFRDVACIGDVSTNTFGNRTAVYLDYRNAKLQSQSIYDTHGDAKKAMDSRLEALKADANSTSANDAIVVDSSPASVVESTEAASRATSASNATPTLNLDVQVSSAPVPVRTASRTPAPARAHTASATPATHAAPAVATPPVATHPSNSNDSYMPTPAQRPPAHAVQNSYSAQPSAVAPLSRAPPPRFATVNASSAASPVPSRGSTFGVEVTAEALSKKPYRQIGLRQYYYLSTLKEGMRPSTIMGVVMENKTPTVARGDGDANVTIYMIDSSEGLIPGSFEVSAQIWRKDISNLPTARKGDVLIITNTVIKRNTVSGTPSLQATSYKDARDPSRFSSWARIRLDSTDNATLHKEPRFKANVSAAEMDYATRLAKWAKAHLGEGGESLEGRNKRMLTELKNVKDRLFFDCIVEVVGIYSTNAVFVTDYTRNHAFDAGLDGYLRPDIGANDHFEPMWQHGGHVVKLRLWGSATSLIPALQMQAREQRRDKVRCLVHLKNVRCKLDELDSAFVETTLGNDRNNFDKIDYSSVSYKDESVQPLVERKEAYLRSKGFSSQPRGAAASTPAPAPAPTPSTPAVPVKAEPVPTSVQIAERFREGGALPRSSALSQRDQSAPVPASSSASANHPQSNSTTNTVERKPLADRTEAHAASSNSNPTSTPELQIPNKDSMQDFEAFKAGRGMEPYFDIQSEKSLTRGTIQQMIADKDKNKKKYLVSGRLQWIFPENIEEIATAFCISCHAKLKTDHAGTTYPCPGQCGVDNFNLVIRFGMHLKDETGRRIALMFTDKNAAQLLWCLNTSLLYDGDEAEVHAATLLFGALTGHISKDKKVGQAPLVTLAVQFVERPGKAEPILMLLPGCRLAFKEKSA